MLQQRTRPGIRPRPVVDLLPATLPASRPSPSRDWQLQVVLQRKPFAAVPRSAAGHRGADRLHPLPRPVEHRAAHRAGPLPGRTGRRHRHRRRKPGAPVQMLRRSPDSTTTAARRSHLPMALLRGLPDLRGTRRRRERPDPADRRRPPRSRCHGRSRHCAHPDDPAVHPQQPHRSDPRHRGNRGLHQRSPSDVVVVIDEAYRSSWRWPCSVVPGSVGLAL